jgi:O-antigen ligase
MNFFFFLVLVATLVIRPADIIGDEDLQLYLLVMGICLVLSGRRILVQLSARSLRGQPITVCLLGLFAAVVMSHLANGMPGEAVKAGIEFGKIVLFYFVMLATLNTPLRLRHFLAWLVGCSVVVTALALLQYHGTIHIASLAKLEEIDVNEETGEIAIVPRLRGTGIFNDPNDLSLLMVVGIILSLYCGGVRQSLLSRIAWLLPVGLFGYALALTRSRGGLLALMPGVLILFQVRFGWKKTILAGAVGLPVLLALFAGRQTSISLGNKKDTAQERIQLWSEGLALLKESPLFGTGWQTFADHLGLVAHNSFVHAFAELGLFGGTCFVGVFYLAFCLLRLHGSRSVEIPNTSLRRLRPYLLAALASYTVGLCSLSRCHFIPTYLVLCLAPVFCGVAAARQGVPVLYWDIRLLRRVALVSVLALVAIYLFTRTFAQFG